VSGALLYLSALWANRRVAPYSLAYTAGLWTMVWAARKGRELAEEEAVEGFRRELEALS
jgi:hypothetical protein